MSRTTDLVRTCVASIVVALASAAVQSQQLAPLTPDIVEQLDAMRAEIERQRNEAAAVESRLAGADGVPLAILEARSTRERLELIAEGVRFAESIEVRREAGFTVDAYQAAAVDVLQENLSVAQTAWDSLIERAEFPASDLPAAEQAARNRSFFEHQRNTDRIIALMADSLRLLGGFGIDVETVETAFAERLRARALNASVYLDMAQEQAAGVRAGLSALPNDAELTAKLSVAETLIAETASTLDRVVGELDDIGVETAGYREQVITATGEITTDVFDFSVIGALFARWGRAFMELTVEEGPAFLVKALIFIVLLFVFYKLSRIVRTIVERGVSRSEAKLSQLLSRMIVSITANLMLAIGVLIALSQIGISLGPLLAGLGIAGFVIGFALQDSLSNFASGLMILFYRPFDVGDVVEVGGATGRVEQMSLVNTTIHTFDNQRIIVPNTMIWGNVIKNVTSQTVRRVDMIFGTSYSDDIPKTEKILGEIIAAHELVLDDPEPTIRVHELADSSINFIVRPWTKTEDYWTVYWDITRAVKMRFDAEGISIPFPQRDVHVIGDATAARAGQTVSVATGS